MWDLLTPSWSLVSPKLGYDQSAGCGVFSHVSD